MLKKVTGVVTSFVLLAWTGTANAGYIVADGWDLFQTDFAAFDFPAPIGEQEFIGVPLGSYNVGGDLQDTGTADTIVHRLGEADSGGAPGQANQIFIEMVALSMISVDEFDLGYGDEFWAVSLASSNESTMTITFDDELGGTFSSVLDFDILLTGQTSENSITIPNIILTANDEPWQHMPTDDALLLPDVNYELGDPELENPAGDPGDPGDQDFFAAPLHDASGASKRAVSPAEAPEPNSIALFGLGLAGLGYLRHKRA